MTTGPGGAGPGAVREPVVPELVVMVGLQAAGKSTWVREHLAGTHAVVSKDHWPNARRRDARQARVVAALLAAGRRVVVDNTNPSPAERAALVTLARQAGVPVRAVWLDVPLAVALARNRARQGRARVPDVGVLAARKRLVPPTLAEGFVRVDVVPVGDEVAPVRPTARAGPPGWR